MMILAKYNTATDLYIPMVKRGVLDLAVSADWTPATGDVKLSKDGGADANIGTLPTAPASTTGKWKFVFTGSELSCKILMVTVIDSATKAVEDQAFIVHTYGHASAMYPTLPADVLAINSVEASAANLERSASVIFRGSVTGSPTTTTFVDTTLTQADTDHWKGRIIIFTSGTLRYQGTDITAFTPASDTLTFTALSNAPSVADTYVIV
jgi:hypothetical protein